LLRDQLTIQIRHHLRSMNICNLDQESFTGDYLGALQQFLDYAVSKNARFVTTMDLVNMSITGIYEAPAASIATAMQLNESKDNSSENVSSGCSECDAKNNASMNATEQNKTTIFVDVS